MQYWYTAQLRNYRLQFIRAFSNIYIMTGPDSSGTTTLSQVPCRYGDPSRIASVIVAGNSENKIPPAPFITCTVSGLSIDAQRRQDPTFVESIRVNERQYDDENDRYLETIGNRYTVQRYMPVPYDLKMQVDIWSNNLSVKEQILEQILQVYNPSIEIQTSNNALDWTSISLIELEEMTWSSRSIPTGTDNPIEVTTLMFKVPIWINPPAKVKKQVIIQQIITNIITGVKEDPEQWGWSEYEFLSRKITTPGDRQIANSWLGNNQYSVSLRSDSGGNVDKMSLPTEKISKANPTLTPGTSFSFNGYVINVTDTTLETLVSNGKAALANTKLNIEIFNFNSIKLTDNTGGDLVLANVVGQPVQDLGLIPTTYRGGTLSWARLFLLYGTLRDYTTYGSNASQLRITVDLEDPDQDIVGWIDMDPVDQNLLTWTVDPQSLPDTTTSNVTAVVDPNKSGPGYGLSDAVTGQRYLLLDTPSQSSAAWGNLSTVHANDIIEFDGQRWNVSFDSIANISTVQYTTNLFSGKLLQWKDGEWVEFIAKNYKQGEWRLSL